MPVLWHDARLPSTIVARSANGGVSADNRFIGRIIQVRNILNKNFTHFSKEPSAAVIGSCATRPVVIDHTLLCSS
jgi:hypothetical protein